MAGIVVVGAGMGALAAAARLATSGHRVTVVERTETVGGSLGTYRRDGFTFDTGPGLLHFPAVWRDLFLKTGREPLEECVDLRRVDPATEHRFADGTTVRLPGFSHAGVTRAMDETFGSGTGDRWRSMLGRARETWEATRRPLLEEPLTPAARAAAEQDDPYPARRAGLLRRRPRTLAAVAEDELRHPGAAAVLTSTVRRYGLDPSTAPAGAALLAYVEQTFGTWYPAGGIGALAEAVRLRCLDRGVEFLLGAEAVRVLERDDRAAGVELADGRRLEAEAVVWGAAWPGPGAVRGTRGRCTLLLALRGARPEGTAHRTVLHAAEPAGAGRPESPPVTVDRPDDRELVPDRLFETAVLSTDVPPHRAGGPADMWSGGDTGVDWTAPGAAERCAEHMLERAEQAGLGLRARVLWQEIRTPAHTERETGTPGGVIAPPVLAGVGGTLLAPATAGRLPGAYRVGGQAHPGGGLVHAGMSGALAAGLIVEGPRWRGSY
ncbi:NAD(P)/FAD-dependent oxidoreductase [Streptomyces sp. SM14]|uniref:phytoene desaturase family protein n=2 Tax=unclassified Streptomyces TaxID=2593676 RepID=UPI000CD561DF|nr:NAD(P)/FAD-dependent oxidoreductase [Streptomyces sp. SM14]